MKHRQALAEDIPLARSMTDLRPSTLLGLLDKAARPDIISFAVGLPATELCPAEGIAASCARWIRADAGVLQYGEPSVSLKRHVVDLMARRGVTCGPEQIVITCGSQQGMDLLARLLLDPGGTVLLESITYEGMQLALRTHQPEILTVPTDVETGCDVDAVEALLASGRRPAFFYTIPEGHNPLGSRLDLGRRRRLAELARRYRMPIIEDDAYGLLTYDGPADPPLLAFEPRFVFYLGSFSKILSPALRAGWMVVPEELVARLCSLKHGSDLNTATFAQRMLARFLDGGGLTEHLERVRATYRGRRDAMLDALERHFPAGVRWSRPKSGIYVWLELPPEVDATALLHHALEHEGVVFTPGTAFAVGGGCSGASCLRLCFGNVSRRRIEEGIHRLSRAYARFTGPPVARPAAEPLEEVAHP